MVKPPSLITIAFLLSTCYSPGSLAAGGAGDSEDTIDTRIKVFPVIHQGLAYLLADESMFLS